LWSIKLATDITMTAKLREEELIRTFPGKEPFSTSDLREFYQQYEPDIPDTTFNWRIYELVKEGVLKRIGWGVFMVGEEKPFLPAVSNREKGIFKNIKDSFPFLDVCIWSTKDISQFMIQQPVRHLLLVEVEKDATEPVLHLLGEKHKQVFLHSTYPLLSHHPFMANDAIVVNRLITQAPLQEVEGMPTTTLEKLLADLVAQPDLFDTYQGSELQTIYQTAAEGYSLNYNRLLRYAKRWGKDHKVHKYLKSLPAYSSLNLKNEHKND
jgi:hypothetical protein